MRKQKSGHILQILPVDLIGVAQKHSGRTRTNWGTWAHQIRPNCPMIMNLSLTL